MVVVPDDTENALTPGPSPAARYALPITRILHCPCAGAGRGCDDGRAPQPGAGSARLWRVWCRYQCWREEPGAGSARLWRVWCRYQCWREEPGAGSARLWRVWCRYQCWREEPGASSRPWRHSRTARTDDRTQRLPYQEALDHTSTLPSPARLCTTHTWCQPRAYQRA
jgi:hypothetical protein